MVRKAGHHGIGHERDEWIATASVEQNVMQIDAMDDDVGKSEASAKRRSGGHSRDLLAAKRVDHQNGGRRVGLCEHRVAHADAIEHMKDIGSELDAIADGAERRRAFEHAHRLSVTCQRKRGRKSAKAAADNEDGVPRADISLTSPSFSSAASRRIRSRDGPRARTAPQTGAQWK